jgi:hypothetical protein
MKLFRLAILLFMALLIILIIGLPGLQDSRRTFNAWSHYHETPNDEKRKELDAARAADKVQTVKIRCVLVFALGASGFLFYKLGKQNIRTSL